MVSQNFHEAYLQEVGLTQISGDHNIFSFSMIDFRTDFRAYSNTDKYHQVVLSNWYILRHII